MALLYAYVPDDLILKLSKYFKQIILWLDWDKNDRVLGRLKRYRSLGLPVRAIMTRFEPKMYQDDLIYKQIYQEEGDS